MVRKKQITISRAITKRKIKFESISKPRKLAKAATGSGKTAIKKKAMGRSSQAAEFLIEIEFRFRLKKMISRRASAARAISI